MRLDGVVNGRPAELAVRPGLDRHRRRQFWCERKSAATHQPPRTGPESRADKGLRVTPECAGDRPGQLRGRSVTVGIGGAGSGAGWPEG
ncbi:MAG: hypothetical protein JWP30_921 [Homoserinimonas sp.]|nr:hypothetical protein [Homoserinimonas sp.]